MNELLQTEHLEDVSQSLYILIFQLLTFSMKRVINNEDDTNLAFFENDEAILEKVNDTIEEITEMIETESQSLSETKLFQENKNLFFRVNELQQKLINSIAKNEEVSSAISKDMNKLIARNDQLQGKLDNSVDKNSKLEIELNICRLKLQNVTYQLDQFNNPRHDHAECGKNKEKFGVVINEAEEDPDAVDSYENKNKEKLENRVENILSQLSIIEEDLKTTTSQANELCNLVKIHEAEKQALKNQVVILLYNLTNLHEEFVFARKQSLNHSELVKSCNTEKGKIQQEFTLKFSETQHHLKDYKDKTDKLEDLLYSYKTQIQETENKLQNTINDFTYSEEELKNAHSKLADLNSVIEMYDTEKIQLQNEIIDLKSNLTNTQEELQSMKSKSEALNKEKNDCTKTINYLDKKLENVLSKLVNTEKELQSLKKGDEEKLKICETEKEALQNETVSKITKTLADLQLSQHETEKQKEIIKACNDEKNILENNLSNEIKVRENKLKDCETLTNSLNNTIETNNNEKNAIENNLKLEISKMREQLQISNKETQKQKETIKKCENGKTEIEKQVTTIKSNLNKKEEEFKAVRNTCEKNQNFLEKTIPYINSSALLKNGSFDVPVPFYILNIHSGLAVGVESANNGKVTAEKQRNHPGQLWVYKNRMLYNTLNGNVLTITSDVKLGLSTPAMASNQLWDFRDNDAIMSNTNRVLDLKDGLFTPGVEVIHYVEHGLKNQQFTVKFADKLISKC